MKKKLETIQKRQKTLKLFLVGAMFLLMSFVAKAQCNASFIDSAISQNTHLFISNSNVSLLANTSYVWNFGDGAAGFGPNVLHNYSANGQYVVILEISSYDSLTSTFCSDSASMFVIVNNLSQSNCLASFNYTSGNAGLINFNNTSLSTLPNFYFSWDFGDGTSSVTSNPSHTYNANGTYTATLVIYGVDSASGITCSASAGNSIVVTNLNSNPCSTASIITNNYGANGVVNFTASSLLLNPLPISYTWNFGDGSFGIGDSISHAYTNNGIYNVLAIAHILGTTCYDTTFKTITVTMAGGLPCNINASFSSAVGANGSAAFTNTTTGSSSLTYSLWDFGDGANSYTTGKGNAQHTYPINGIYNVILVVKDTILNCTDTFSNSIVISNASGGNCNASFFNTPDSLNGVWFISTSAGVTQNTNYSWSFGDGSNGSGQFVNHTYSNNGNYTVTLIISTVDSMNNFLCFDSTSSQVVVGPICNANVSLQLIKDTTGTLLWTAYPVYSPTTVSAVWHWGDGTSTSGFAPSHTYPAPGIYNICVVVTDSCGGMDTACITTNIMKVSNVSGLMYTVNVVSNFTPLTIKNVTNDNIKMNIYPNPNNGEFTINSKSETQFSVINELGQIIKIDTTNAANNFSTKVSGLNTGVYFILANSKNITYRSKIVVTK